MKSLSMPIRYIVGVSFIVRDIATQFMFILDPYFCRLNQNKGHHFFGLSHIANYLIDQREFGVPNLETTAPRQCICTTVPTAGCKDD